MIPQSPSILIIQTAFLGDLILTTPFFHAVKKSFPHSKISVVVGKGTESVLEGNPSLEKILVMDKKRAKKSLKYFFQFIGEVRRVKPDIVYSPHFSFRSSLLSFLSGAKVRIGYKESGFSFLHTKTVSRPKLGKHEVDKLFSLLFENENDYPQGRERRPFLYISDSAIENAKNKLNGIKVFNQNYITICPSSVWETKKYIPESFSRLIQLIWERTEYGMVLTGSPADKDLNSHILSQAVHFLRNSKNYMKNNFNIKERVLDLSGKTTLSEMAAVISESKAVITNDSSPVHYASAFNIPTVMIYGATVPDFGYYGLMDKLEIAQIDGLDCRPCGIHGGNICPEKHFRCMREQSPESIFNRLQNIL